MTPDPSNPCSSTVVQQRGVPNSEVDLYSSVVGTADSVH